MLTTLVEAFGASATYQYVYEYEYEYDGANNLIRVDAGNITPTMLVELEHGPGAQRSVLSREIGVTTTYEYDPAGQVTSIQHTRDSDEEVLSSFQYSYDAAGHRTSRLSNDGLILYSYDDAGRLLTAASSGSTETFEMDDVGNLTRIDNTTGDRDLEYDDANRLETEVSGITTTFTYDDNGDMTEKSVSGVDHKYTWNDRNQLVDYSIGITPVMTYAYYPESDLILSATPDGETPGIVLWNGQNTLADLYVTEDNYLALFRHYGSSQAYDDIFAARDLTRNGQDHYLRDALMSVYQVANTNANIAAAYNYSAYGEPRDWDDAEDTNNRFTFTGREYDPASGMYYYRARWYDSARGRFASVDPLGLGLSEKTNLYWYADDAPSNYRDPSGLCACVEDWTEER